MSQSVFSYREYKKFLLDRIEESTPGGRGIRGQLAEAVGCQSAYVSHVLAGDKHFSLEQIEAAARYFRLREDETEFLILLLQHERAGTVSLERYFAKQVDSRRRDYNEIKKRMKIAEMISSDDQLIYYSSWHYQAVRSLIQLPGFRSAKAIAERLNIKPEKVNEVLEFLLSKGLITENKHGYQTTSLAVHLPRSSPLIGKLHANWRVKTLSAIESSREDDYHYSGVVTLARKDISVVREILMQALQSAAEVIKPSKEEEICVLAMDFFTL